MRGSHSCKIRAVAIVSHHQWCARLELIANRLVDRNRLSTRAQWLTSGVSKRDGDDGFGVRTRRKSVGGDLQRAQEEVRKLHAVLEPHGSRSDLRRIRIETEEGLNRSDALGITGQIGDIGAIERTTLHRAGLRIERLLDGLQIEGAEVRANEHARLDQASGIQE